MGSGGRVGSVRVGSGRGKVENKTNSAQAELGNSEENGPSLCLLNQFNNLYLDQVQYVKVHLS